MTEFLRALKNAPWSAQLGVFIIAVNLFAMVFAPWLAPFGETDVVDGAAHVCEQALDLSEGLRRSADEVDELPRFGLGTRAGHGGVEQLGTCLAHVTGELVDPRGTQRARLDGEGPGA